MSQYFLCNRHDIPNYQARSFDIDTPDGKFELFAVRQDNQVQAYQNQCPHLGIPLNWQPDEFMSLEGTHIQCSTHGALFTLEQGHCVAGPCSGQSLTSLTIELRNNDEVWLQL
ncbi:MAG: Rieske (2Fe-2S) protein [Gammaproteobacteria bacterium]|nr:Rieske (2Fe-2S) protein [Gammaproteobacteria bacterium]